MQTATRVTHFGESVIREMTRLSIQHDAINLSQGYPDFDTPEALKQAAVEAIRAGENQYSITWGHPLLRQKLAELYTPRLGWQVDPDVHITVTCGVSEALAASMLAVLDPGDQIIIIEPAHESFHPCAHFAGAEPVAVPLQRPDYRLDPDRLAAAVNSRTRALVLNTPHNPTGRVFDAEELAGVIRTVVENDLVLITDEIYDRILYDGRQHVSPGSLEPLRERTITIGGLSKTFAITGWRLGYVIAQQTLAAAVRPVHDFLTICAATPLQAAAATALDFPESYYEQMRLDYHDRRKVMMEVLDSVGFNAVQPEGAYYVLADYNDLDIPQADWHADRFGRWLTTDVGVAVVPANRLYSQPGYGERSVRFAYPKRLETLQEAGERLRQGLGV